MKIVRYLLRVSSDQQLEADGDLSIQRQIVLEYIDKHDDWKLDTDVHKREYFEPGVSGYKNKAVDREVLQTILKDARNQEFDILVMYKDDRVGRLMWDTPQYIMQLKSYGVDSYSVKDGRLTPESDDVMAQMMLTFRYANAQKSSADTGMRVKDTAQKLVEQGKFMGGKAPFGYDLEYSGQISKHGRALKHLVIVPEQAEVVRYIYSLSLNKEFGSTRIAKELNTHEIYKDMAPNDVWKTGTITSILSNPIYTGHTAYKRREKVNDKYHRLHSKEWIVSLEADEKIQIIDEITWDRAQEKRRQRRDKCISRHDRSEMTIIGRNDGMLPLIDVIYCGHCGRKLTNGSRYNYWTIKETGEKRASKLAAYKCQSAWNGMVHEGGYFYRADKIEPIIFQAMAEYISQIQNQSDVFEGIKKKRKQEILQKEKEIVKKKQEMQSIEKKIAVLEEQIPLALLGEIALTVDELTALLRKQKASLAEMESFIQTKELELQNAEISFSEWEEVKKNIPTWQEVFLNADTCSKRVLVNKLIDRIDITKEEMVVNFKINLEEFLHQPRMKCDSGVPESGV